MKKFRIAATSLVGLLAYGESVLAADMAIEPAYDWTGFYLGASGGLALNSSTSNDLSTDSSTPTNLGDSIAFSRGSIGDLESDGWSGGLQAGYNLQSARLVFGVEADVQGGGISDDISGDFSNPNGTIPINGSTSLDVDWFGTLRGRLGTRFDRLLIYGTGGIAIGGINTSMDGIETASVLFETHLSSSGTEFGYVVGAGAEFAFSESWTMKLEYQYIDFGNVSASSPVLDIGTTDPTGETAKQRCRGRIPSIRLGSFQFLRNNRRPIRALFLF